MKTNLYLVTVKDNNTTELHIPGSNIVDALNSAYIYMDNIKTPGVGYEITDIKYVGKVVISKRDL